MGIVVTKLNDRNIAYLLKSPSGSVGRWLTRQAVLVTAKAKSQAGVKTGALKASINWSYGINPVGPFVKIGSSVSYAYVHHEGTKAHIITPRTNKSLKFSSKGAIIFTQRVRHPGTRPNRYLTDNLKWFKNYKPG
jgi:hypothetical protein